MRADSPPLIPAQAGIQKQPPSLLQRLDSRVRGNERGWRRGILLARSLAWLAGLLVVLGFAKAPAQEALVSFTVVSDAIPASLTGKKGDPERGRAIVANRQLGLCLLCHSGPFPEERFQGTMAPDLSGAGARWSEGQLRLRIVDAGRLNAATIMPPYYRVDGLTRVLPAFRGKPILTAEQIEDVVAYLTTLRE